MSRSLHFFVLVFCLCAAFPGFAADTATASRLQQQGQFEAAAGEWETLAQRYSLEKNLIAQAHALLGQGESLSALGMAPASLTVLKQALAISGTDTALRAKILGAMAQCKLMLGKQEDAEALLQSGMALARESGRDDLIASVLGSLGLLHETRKNQEQALQEYQAAADKARDASQPLLHAQSLGNAARTALALDDSKLAGSLTRQSLEACKRLEDGHDKAYLLISLGQLLRRLDKDDTRAGQTLRQALVVADAIGDRRAKSYALGDLAQIAAEQSDPSNADTLYQRAIFAAQEVGAGEILYRWHWQQGRLQHSRGNTDGAIASYRRAVFHLQTIRADLGMGVARTSSFREVLGPLYFELADLLLRRAAAEPVAEAKQKLLGEARATVEQSKEAELQDYFQDSCVAARRNRPGTARFGNEVAVIYPILLPDRLEILADFSSGIAQFTVAVPSARVIEEIRIFRTLLEKRTTRQYLPHGQALYRWLIAPLEGELHARQISTLIFVPDGALRTIPMAALHDDTRFLAERYAIATTPSLSLTDMGPPRTAGGRALLNGLTLPVQGYAGLPNVEAELQAVGHYFAGKTLQDKQYLVGNVQEELSETPYSVVHIASHGQFEGDVKQTFLLTYDGRLTMDLLEKLISPGRQRNQPISLLTLSACQTAAGDDRAALGLAGVSVKAGASSALASLWFINDQSATLLVSEFYHRLSQPATSKAEALRGAQMKLLADKRFNHPGYWSPFLLIGSWL
ncbi:MAG: CHAT domain-containing protein [Sulfuricella denitrificans]|nr:CHAT domain-containing protein [Sulfuricella denitrificans]